MGIGRREFLRQFGGMIAAFSAASSNAVAVCDDQYINRKLGIAFVKPVGWCFSDIREMGKVKDSQILDLDDPDLAAAILEEIELPLLTISKEPISSGANQFTPGITINLDDFSGLESSSLLEVTENDIQFNEIVFKDFTILSSPKITEVSKSEATKYEASFVFEHDNMAPTPVRMSSITVRQQLRGYTLRMFDAPLAKPQMTVDYTQFVQTLRVL